MGHRTVVRAALWGAFLAALFAEHAARAYMAPWNTEPDYHAYGTNLIVQKEASAATHHSPRKLMQTSGTSITVPDSDFTTAAGGVTTYQYSISASSAWKSTSGGVGIIASGNPSWGRVTAVGGSGYYAFLQGGSASIYQTITGLSSGSTFVFSWYQQGRPNYGTNDLSVSVSTSVSGTYTELYYNNSVITGGGWSQMSTAAYRLQSGSQIVIRFATSNGRGGDAAVFIDQVTLLKLDCGNPFRICANATEGTSLTLACPAGYRISSVPFASYGTPTPGAPISSTTCSIVNGASTFTKSSCHAATSQSIFDGNCTRTSQCQIPVNNAAFGVDPCPYTVKWAEAQANCLPAGCQWSETDFVRHTGMNRGGPNSYSGNAVTSIMTGVQNYYVVGFGSSYDDITPVVLIFYGLFNDLNHKLYPTWFLQWVPSFNPTANATSPWWNIISQYTDANNKHPAANGFDVIFDLNVKNGPQDTGTTTLTRVDVENIVQIASQTQPPAASRATTNDAIYVVIGGENIGYSDPLVGDFCTSMCAYHDVITLGSSNYLKYTFIGFPTRCGSNACTGPITDTNAPNGMVADSLITVLAHEIAEIVTNPVSNAPRNGVTSSSNLYGGWYQYGVDGHVGEISDRCAWDFTGSQLVPGSSTKRYTIGITCDTNANLQNAKNFFGASFSCNQYFLVQKLWNERYSKCSMELSDNGVDATNLDQRWTTTGDDAGTGISCVAGHCSCFAGHCSCFAGHCSCVTGHCEGAYDGSGGLRRQLRPAWEEDLLASSNGSGDAQ